MTALAAPMTLDAATTVLVNLLVVVGMVVVVPMGLALLAEPRWVGHTWWVGAALGAVALWLPRGAVAVALAAGYAAVCGLLAARAPRRLWRGWRADDGWPTAVAAATALAAPAVAGLALVAERGGHRLLGFELEILLLTVAHFHYAGFAAALVAGLLCRVSGGRLSRWVAVTVPAGTALVLVGFFTGAAVELAGAAVLTAGMWGAGWLTWTQAGGRDRTTRVLLGVSATVLVATMALALSWALGRATGLPHPSLAWMVATHGLGNALGFALCGLLAWRRLGVSLPAGGAAGGARRTAHPRLTGHGVG